MRGLSDCLVAGPSPLQYNLVGHMNCIGRIHSQERPKARESGSYREYSAPFSLGQLKGLVCLPASESRQWWWVCRVSDAISTPREPMLNIS